MRILFILNASISNYEHLCLSLKNDRINTDYQECVIVNVGGSGKYCHCSHKSSSPDSTVSHQTIKKRDSFIHWSFSGAAQITTRRIVCLLICCHGFFDWKQGMKGIHFCFNSTLCLSIVTDLVRADIIHPLNK